MLLLLHFEAVAARRLLRPATYGSFGIPAFGRMAVAKMAEKSCDE